MPETSRNSSVASLALKMPLPDVSPTMVGSISGHSPKPVSKPQYALQARHVEQGIGRAEVSSPMKPTTWTPSSSCAVTAPASITILRISSNCLAP